jgi:hypothetical protein
MATSHQFQVTLAMTMMALGRQKFHKKEDEKLSKTEREIKKKEKRPALTDDYQKPRVIGNPPLPNSS